MITWKDIAALSPIATQQLPDDTPITGADIDSRRIRQNMLFIARQGEKTDGHQFIHQALKNGACAIIVEKGWYESAREDSTELPLIVVDDSDQALRDLAVLVRAKFDGPVLGITGSNGKTTTKEMLRAVLSREFNVLATPGNFNNLWGLPLTILQATSDHDFWILEHGMNRPGEISELCAISQPNAGLVTTIAESHSHYFHSLDEIAEEKLSLFNTLPEDGITFKNIDNKYIKQYTPHTKRVVTYGVENPAQYRAFFASLDAYSRVSCQMNALGRVRLRAPGMFQMTNALAAAAVGNTFGVPGRAIKEELENFRGVPGRVNIIEKDDCTIIDDTYNANPNSMRESIDILAKMPAGNRRIAILGDMLELNSTAEKKHREIGAYLVDHKIDVIVGVGPLSRNIIDGASALNGATTYHFSDYRECINKIKDVIRAGDIILVKGSHGIHLEHVVEAL